MKIKKNLALSDSGFVFNPSSGDTFSTNPIGLEIINHLKQGLDKDEIKKLIMKRYQIEATAFEKDYYDFVTTLKQLKLTDGDEKA